MSTPGLFRFASVRVVRLSFSSCGDEYELLASLRAARLLLLVNYRPEYQHPRGSRTCYAQLWLTPCL